MGVSGEAASSSCAWRYIAFAAALLFASGGIYTRHTNIWPDSCGKVSERVKKSQEKHFFEFVPELFLKTKIKIII